MKIAINLKEFKKVLKTIGKSVDSGKIFFRIFDDNNFDIINTNLEKVVKYKYRKNEDNEIDFSKHDTFEVDACISNVVEKMTGDSDNVTISLDKKGESINLNKGRLKAKLTINRNSIFNDMDEVASGNILAQVKKTSINEAFSKVIAAVSKSNSIPDSLKSLCFNIKDDECFAASTDNSRFHTYSFKVDKATDSAKYVIPSKNILEAIRVFSSVDDETCDLINYENMLMFRFKNVDLCVNVYEQGFRDFEKILKYINEDFTISVDGKTLKDTLSPILAFASTQIFSSTVKIDIKDNEMKIFSSSDRGNLEDVIEIEGNVPSRLMVFNGAILNDVVLHLCDSRIIFILDHDESKPVKMTNEDGSMVNVVMTLQKDVELGATA